MAPADASSGTFPAARDFRPRALHRRVLVLLLLGSVVPLTILALGAWITFGGILEDRARDHLRTVVRDHAATLDLFLDEWLAALRTVSALEARDEIMAPGRIAAILDELNRAWGRSFADLGVIADDGRHLAYAGPEDLMGRNYLGAEWFRKVAAEGQSVSDVFLGFRNRPHFVMAVRRDDPAGGFWILRATVNSEVFDRIVARGRLGETGDCFVLDREGRYQTPPAAGAPVLSPSGIDVSATTGPARVEPGGGDEIRQLRTMEPIRNGRWILVAQQSEAEAMAPVRRAMGKGLLVFAAAVVVIGVTTFLATRFLVRLVTSGVARAEELSRRFLRASQLASIGEMATGLAHEINNPLAIILSEQTNVSDLLGELPPDERTTEMGESVARTKRQVDRCKSITLKMLQFGRSSAGEARVVDPRAQLAEIVGLLETRARVDGVELALEADGDLPAIRIDPGELQQVVTNLVNNAVQAMPGGGRCTVSARAEGGDVVIAVLDTGPGIPPELREKIFEPFFTTKPVGKGTGLGLSVCYGIVARWQGRIAIEDGEPAGARFVLRFPAVARIRDPLAKGD